MLAQHQHVRAVRPDRLGRDDLVRGRVLEHAVLVDARLVCKRVRSDDGLVGLHGDAGVCRNHLGRAHDLLRLDVAVDREEVRPRAQRHDNLLEGCVARALAQRVEGHLDLPRASRDCGERVCSREAEVVVAVGGPDDAVCALDVCDQVREERRVLVRQRVADSVGQVDGGGARLDDGLAQLDEEGGVGPPGVLGRELDVVDHRLCESDHRRGDLDALCARDAELVLEVDVGGGEEGVYPVERRVPHRLVAPLQVLLVRAREPGDPHRLPASPAVGELARRLGDLRDGREVALRRDRKARLAHVHAQPRQLLRNLDLLRLSQRRAGRLLAVAQRRVEDDELVGRRLRREGARRRSWPPQSAAGGHGRPASAPEGRAEHGTSRLLRDESC
mmetsp:Transcript_27396/g.81852  ORF Transcript_27396/g.81852 Transcript_27396/m.81852 type:complete len:388 (-) Transcript_27396:8-1171(-)